MVTSRFGGILALTLLLGVGACDDADEADPNGDVGTPGQPTAEQQMDPEMMAAVMEMQTIQQQLGPIQERALQDEELAAQLQEIQTRLEAALREDNAEAMDRMDELQTEMMEAQAAGDQQQMQALMPEAQSLQQQLQAAQQDVLQRPDLRQAIEEFEAANRARMIEIDPAADSLLQRMDELMGSMPQQ